MSVSDIRDREVATKLEKYHVVLMEYVCIITKRRAIEAGLYQLNLRDNCLAVVYPLFQK